MKLILILIMGIVFSLLVGVRFLFFNKNKLTTSDKVFYSLMTIFPICICILIFLILQPYVKI
jgi:hypothetical protein